MTARSHTKKQRNHKRRLRQLDQRKEDQTPAYERPAWMREPDALRDWAALRRAHPTPEDP